MRRAWVMIGATIATFVVPLLVLVVLRNPYESTDCTPSRCNFPGLDEARRVLNGEQGDGGLEEHGWRAAILEDIGDPSEMLTCDHDAATVTVLSWVGEGDDFIIPTYVLGWRDGETACSETRTARITDIPYDALDADFALGGSVTIALPSIGDTFVIASDG